MNILDSVLTGAGVLTGGPSQEKALLAGAQLKSTINDALFKAGQRVGGTLGSNALQSLTSGAQQTSTKAQAKLTSQVLADPGVQQKLEIAAVVILTGLLFYLMRRGKK